MHDAPQRGGRAPFTAMTTHEWSERAACLDIDPECRFACVSIWRQGSAWIDSAPV